MKKGELIFIEHILESITDIEMFMDGVTKEAFFKNKEKQSAVVRQIEIIGEAVKNLPAQFRKAYQNIPWKRIAGMRDKLLHHYFGVDLNIVWTAWKEEIPKLKEDILSVKKELEIKREKNR